MSKSNYDALQNVFLIAMPQLKDPYFSQSIVYVWEYNAQGAKGVIINKPMKSHLGDLLRHLEIPIQDKRAELHPMLVGGPVATDQGFLVQRNLDRDWETGKTELRISICSSKDSLTPLAEGQGLKDTLVAIGFASWEPGQLDEELKNNDWLVAPFNENTLFATLAAHNSSESNAAYSWRGAVTNMGINLSNLSPEAGHA